MNLSEQMNREKKAAKMAAVLFKCGATFEDVINATPEQWALCAEAAGCHPPNSQATVDLVAKMLAERYEWAKEPAPALTAAADRIDQTKWNTENHDEKD